jgi:hypothetical protein
MTMIAEKAVAVDRPQILADGSVYAVRIGSRWFSYFKEGTAWVGDIAHCVTKAEAEEIAAKVGDYAEVVQMRAKNNGLGFWVTGKYTECYGERSIKIGTQVRDRLDGVPDWFVTSMKVFAPSEEWGDEEYTDTERTLDVFFHNADHSWLDHYGWIGEGENSDFVSEPYHLTQTAIEALVEDCRKFNFKYEISGRSRHYPSSTVRIIVSPKAA